MQTITGSALYAPYTSVLGATLDNCINHTEFTSLFDQYRIDWVRAKFYLKIDPSAQTAATASFPRMYWYRDYDDNTVGDGTFLQDVRENQKGKVAVMNPNRPVTITFKPNVLAETFRTGSTTCYSPKFGQWISSAAPNCIHFGIKYGIDDLTNTNYRVNLEITYGLSMRQSK